MKTIITTILLSLIFSVTAVAQNFAPMSLAPELEGLRTKSVIHMTNVYTSVEGALVEVTTEKGLDDLDVNDAEDVLQGSLELNNSSALDSYIDEVNAIFGLGNPIFMRSKCCFCGDCPD